MASQEPGWPLRHSGLDLEQAFRAISERLKTQIQSSNVLMAFLRQKQVGRLGNCRRNMDGWVIPARWLDWITARNEWYGTGYSIRNGGVCGVIWQFSLSDSLEFSMAWLLLSVALFWSIFVRNGCGFVNYDWWWMVGCIYMMERWLGLPRRWRLQHDMRTTQGDWDDGLLKHACTAQVKEHLDATQPMHLFINPLRLCPPYLVTYDSAAYLKVNPFHQ